MGNEALGDPISYEFCKSLEIVVCVRQADRPCVYIACIAHHAAED